MADDNVGSTADARSGRFPTSLAILPLRDTVLFPQCGAAARGRAGPSSVRLIEEAVRGGRLIGVVTQRDPAAEDAQASRTCTASAPWPSIHKVLKQPDGTRAPRRAGAAAASASSR